jgi:hypothetical protein
MPAHRANRREYGKPTTKTRSRNDEIRMTNDERGLLEWVIGDSVAVFVFLRVFESSWLEFYGAKHCQD